jgi:glyoxylase-like metal-dependent hydrolase (beta-lactamase superfamily II)
MRHDRSEAITSNILLVHGERRAKFPYSHSILILDESVALIDTGCGLEVLREIKKSYDIDFIINSHTHPDHSACNWLFNGKPIYVPEEGFDTSGNVVALSERFVSKKLAPIWQKFVKDLMNFRNCKPTNSYNSNTIFKFGKTTLAPIYTPGHTRDHYCFYEKKNRILFSFDYDLTQFPWYGHKESSLSEFRESIMKLRALSPEIVVSSHRGVITENINVEFAKFYNIIDERNARILSSLEDGKTLDQLVDMAPIYGTFPYAQPLLRYWESMMIETHLEELERNNKIRKQNNVYIKIGG